MREKRRTLQRAMFSLESLDDRVLLSAAAVAHLAHPHAAVHSTPVQNHRAHAVQSSPKIAQAPISAVSPKGSATTKRAVAPSAIAPVVSTIKVANPTVQTPTSPGLVTPVSTFPTGAIMTSSASSPTPTPTAAPTNIGDIQNGPMAKAGQQLITLYQQFEQSGGSETFTSSLSSVIQIHGSSVGVTVNGTAGGFSTLAASLTSMGMQIIASDASTATVQGFLPIAQLPNVAQLPETLSMSPLHVPVRR